MKPQKKFSKYFAGLFTVKTIVTLAIVFVVCFKTLQGLEMSDAFIMIATAVITYYFCKDNSDEERMKKHEEKYH